MCFFVTRYYMQVLLQNDDVPQCESALMTLSQPLLHFMLLHWNLSQYKCILVRWDVSCSESCWGATQQEQSIKLISEGRQRCVPSVLADQLQEFASSWHALSARQMLSLDTSSSTS
jgi:hypothetical protein